MSFIIYYSFVLLPVVNQKMPSVPKSRTLNRCGPYGQMQSVQKSRTLNQRFTFDRPSNNGDTQGAITPQLPQNPQTTSIVAAGQPQSLGELHVVVGDSRNNSDVPIVILPDTQESKTSSDDASQAPVAPPTTPTHGLTLMFESFGLSDKVMQDSGKMEED